MITVSQTLSLDDWNDIAETVEDISNELPDGFLMIYQWMRAKIRWNGKVYYASGWHPPDSKPYVELTEDKIRT